MERSNCWWTHYLGHLSLPCHGTRAVPIYQGLDLSNVRNLGQRLKSLRTKYVHIIQQLKETTPATTLTSSTSTMLANATEVWPQIRKAATKRFCRQHQCNEGSHLEGSFGVILDLQTFLPSRCACMCVMAATTADILEILSLQAWK